MASEPRGESAGALLGRPRKVATVLVVDDDEDARDSVADMLREEGFGVLTASDGYEALELAAAQPRPAAMILDLGMPRMGGREVLRKLQTRDELAKIPVCVLSGALEDSELPLGATLAIQKPLLVHRLVQILEWLRQCADGARTAS